ncbi:MAG TPA: DUF6644 family protein [Rhizomicrobium sp.]|nr:DUF6644 family protein [Rhizomicrobium sp.]
MAWLEASPLGQLMRETGVWTYAIVNLFHIIAIAALFGAICVLDLRLLGVWRSIPLGMISRPAVNVAGTGFALAVLTGVPMLATKAVEYADNPFLLPKFFFIALALANLAALHLSTAWREHRVRELTQPEMKRLSVMGAASLVFWLGVITNGRLIGYW